MIVMFHVEVLIVKFSFGNDNERISKMKQSFKYLNKNMLKI